MKITLYLHDAIPNELEELYEKKPGLQEYLDGESAEDRLYYSLKEIELDCEVGTDGSVRMLECRWNGQRLTGAMP